MGADFRFFFAQTGCAALWGIAFAAVMSGLGTAAHVASTSLRDRLAGARGGWLRHILRACLVGNMLLALRDAMRVGKMTLPFAHAAEIAALAVLALALMVNLGGRPLLCVGLMGLTVLITLWAAALLCFGRLPAAAGAMGGCELHLERAPAAIVLAALRCAAGMVPCTIALAHAPISGRQPLRCGAAVAVIWAGQLVLMNVAMKRQPLSLQLLAQPFAAMACAWGRGGYYAVCALTALASVFSLAFSLGALLCLTGDQRDVKSWFWPRC